MRKFASIVLFLLLLMLLMPIFEARQSFAELPKPYLEVDPQIQNFLDFRRWVGTTFEEYVRVNQTDVGWDLVNATTFLQYNSTLLSAVNVTFNGLWNATDWTEQSLGDIRLTASNPSSISNGEVLLATVTFKIIYQGTSPPRLFGDYDVSMLDLHDYVLLNSIGSPIPTDPETDGLVTIWVSLGAPPYIIIDSVSLPKNAVGQNCSLTFNVTILFYKCYPPPQASTNVTVYANSTLIAFMNVTYNNEPYFLVNRTVVWDTTGFAKGNYMIVANATPLPGEDQPDHNVTVGPVKVTIPGDITSSYSVPDGKVDIRDVSLAAKHFGSFPWNPLWDPRADVNGDGKADIVDVSTAARHFGEMDSSYA